jgi:heme/copper-type cytochrome/quinol oxidase subunit 2
MSTANYYGEGERHFGLVHSDGSQKPAAAVWVGGVKAVRSGTASTTTASSSGTATTSAAAGGAFSAGFTPKAVGNDWWVETAVAADQGVAKVEARLGAGTWQALPKDDWGTYAASLHAPDGTPVQFRAASTSGALAYSATYTWT